MQTRVALISIIVTDSDAVAHVNNELHKYGEHIIGRMGLPYRERKVCLISVALDAPQDIINALSGRLGAIRGVTVKTITTNIVQDIACCAQ